MEKQKNFQIKLKGIESFQQTQICKTLNLIA